MSNTLGREVRRVRRPGALADQNAESRRAAARLFQLLDLAHPHAGGEFVARRDRAFGIGGACVQRLADHIRGQFGGVSLVQAVPPTVMRSILMVGMPTPT